MAFDPVADYPLGSRRPDLVRTPSGLGLDELTLDAARAGRIAPNDLRATPETLRLQSAVALAAGRSQLADNLAAADLVLSPEERARLWPRLVALYADYENYQAWCPREIPVAICSPRPA